MGWGDYKSGGKLAALLLAVLLFLWFAGKAREQAAFLTYTSVMTVCCILPATAVLFMLYQTKFYDYEWIWSMVPLTAVTAYGCTLFLWWLWTEWEGRGLRRSLPVTLLLVVALFFCGNLGTQAQAREERKVEKEDAYRILEELSEQYPQRELCLWAPREVMEYARETDAGFRLPYGRNMWDASLNAYAYDGYGEKETDLYEWMGQVKESAVVWMPEEKVEEITGALEERVQDALELEVNCVLFPEKTLPGIVECMEAELGVEARLLDGYYVFLMPGETKQ